MEQETAPPVIAGDHSDDDAQVLDDLVESQGFPIESDSLPQVSSEAPRVPKGVITRVIGSTLTMLSTWAPVLFLTADTRRRSVRIRMVSTTSTDYVRVGDDPGKLQSVGGSALVWSGQDTELAGHTGPVWVSAADAAGTVIVTVVAVTE